MSNRTKLDKIFDNTYGETEYEHENLTFKLDPNFESSLSEEERIHRALLHEEIDEIISNSKYIKLNEVGENGKAPKLNKVQINEVFGYVVDNLKKTYRKIEVFSQMSDYFDIYPKKFYTSLSNKYKDQLMRELNDATGVLDKKNIKKLY